MKRHLHAFIQGLWFAIVKAAAFSPTGLILLTVATVINSLLPALNVIISKKLLDSVISILSGSGTGGTSQFYYILSIQGLVLAAGSGISSFEKWISYKTGREISHKMQEQLFETISAYEMKNFDNSDFYNKMSRARVECQSRVMQIIYGIFSFLGGTVTLISMAGIIFNFDAGLLYILVMAGVPVLLIRNHFGSRRYGMIYERAENRRKAWLLADLMSRRDNMVEIFFFDLWGHLIRRWKKFNEKFLQDDIRFSGIEKFWTGSVDLILKCSPLLVLAIVIFSASDSGTKITAGTAMMVTSAFKGAAGNIKRIAYSLSKIYENILFLNDVSDFENQKPVKVSKKQRLCEKIESVEFKDVGFGYQRNHRVLENVCFRFEKGKIYLLSGGNGSGKTTLIKLLTGLYRPVKGTVLINGVDLECLDKRSVRRKMSGIFQPFARFPFTARENIQCGNIFDTGSEAGLKRAIDLAGVGGFLSDLSNGLETTLGGMFREGVDLSMGQWQKICLARMFSRDGDVLIFDEPTACMDVETQDRFFTDLKKICHNKIGLIISHRPNFAGQVDEIITLKSGRIQKPGAADDIMVKSKNYSGIGELQEKH